jgi:MYXO-CTERM domain-containing protein
VVNPTECPIDGAALVEQVQDAELVAGTARIDGRPVEATLEDGRLTIPGLSLAPGEPHQVSFDLRPHVLGAPAPTAQILLRGVPISENTSLSAPPTAAGCSCRTASEGAEAFGYLALVGFLLIWRKRHATARREMRKSIR